MKISFDSRFNIFYNAFKVAANEETIYSQPVKTISGKEDDRTGKGSSIDCFS